MAKTAFLDGRDQSVMNYLANRVDFTHSCPYLYAERNFYFKAECIYFCLKGTRKLSGSHYY